ncbi:Antibiotic biosynthesis monooxygenase [Paenibacillus curdlanolyticus YK9]|uniref:Antibiotic biosynthesis monooxygenase n=1 Tax=Paenibacillus curdlanolyticus YK9 TaxID=717606 RepID=E0I6Q5_9BACL|nr:antibiotic biosynthesis monooxygenase family protein [Paenibacillus curdlanolyticus]EFM11721.1 Antibiotic biosynthesis monooxygenase [Paenibacillus curdlanolyticus YK9]
MSAEQVVPWADMAGLTQPAMHLDEAADQRIRLQPFPVVWRHEQKEQLQHAIDSLNRVYEEGFAHSGAILRGLNGKDVLSLIRLSPQAISDESGLGANAMPNRYHIERIDHRSGSNRSVIEQGSSLFHYVVMFKLTPGKQNELLASFDRAIAHVRQQPGYVSTSLLLSHDGRMAVLMGQFESRQQFRASLRQRKVIGVFAHGMFRRITASFRGDWTKPPRIRLYELAHVAAPRALSSEHTSRN